jgi:hypothetical protein
MQELHALLRIEAVFERVPIQVHAGFVLAGLLEDRVDRGEELLVVRFEGERAPVEGQRSLVLSELAEQLPPSVRSSWNSLATVSSAAR